MIPKIIHYCWLSDDPVPEDMQAYMSTWKQLDGYTFMKWDFNRFTEDVPWVREAFAAKKYAFACDYIRLYAVYHYGGIYMDMDMELVKPFDDLLDAPLMLALEVDETTRIEAGCFGAEKGHPFIKKCLDYYDGRHFVLEDGSYDERVAPDIISEFIDACDAEIHTSDYFTAKNFRTGKIKITENTHTIHHFKDSWMDEMHQVLSKRLESYSGKSLGRLPRLKIALEYSTEKYGFFGGIAFMIREKKKGLQKKRAEEKRRQARREG